MQTLENPKRQINAKGSDICCKGWSGIMKKVELKNVKEYEAPGHFKMVAMRLHGKEETGTKNMWMGLSHFLPGGGAQMGASNTEKIYFVLSGTVTVVSSDKKETTLQPTDSLYIPAGEERSIINKENTPASMLVISSYT
jgi:quercetin dioxygenase-like cupin family protein